MELWCVEVEFVCFVNCVWCFGDCVIVFWELFYGVLGTVLLCFGNCIMEFAVPETHC